MWSALASHCDGRGRVLPTLRGPVCPVPRTPGPEDGYPNWNTEQGSTADRGWRCALSALAAVLPQVFATASFTRAVEQRKGPHSLLLVSASALPEPVASAREEAQPAGYEFYRKYTEAMLRRYMTMSMEAGRVPSLLGRELFRGNVTHYNVSSFEDVVIFVHDVEKCLANLGKGQQHLVRRIALEEYTQGETAALLGLSLRTVVRNYSDALDRLTRLFLEKGMLHPLSASREEALVL